MLKLLYDVVRIKPIGLLIGDGVSCIGGWMRDGLAGFCGRGTSLTGSVLPMAAVRCFGAGDGPGDPLA
jgi:hypothetical protein